MAEQHSRRSADLEMEDAIGDVTDDMAVLHVVSRPLMDSKGNAWDFVKAERISGHQLYLFTDTQATALVVALLHMENSVRALHCAFHGEDAS